MDSKKALAFSRERKSFSLGDLQRGLNQQEVIKLRFFDGLSFKEISEQTNTSINTTLGRVRYALINMRKIMEENQVILTR